MPTETITAKLELAADNFTSTIDGALSSLGSLESQAQSVDKSVAAMGGALAAVSAGGLAASISAAGDLDAALTESTAIMGDVSDAMRDDMSQAARQVAKDTTFAADEAGEAFYFLASAGMDAEQSIEALPQVADFAQAGMFDLATATDLATDAQSVLGMTSEDAAENQENLAEVTDTLVKANTLANASVEEFSSALTNQAGAAMREAGMEIQEGTSALAVFADQGLKGNKAGTILARTIQGLQEQARENADAFDELGVQVFDAEGEMRPMADITQDLEGALEGMSTEQRNAALSQLGLNERAQQGVSLMMGNSEAMREYEGELADAGGTTQEVADNQLQSFQAQMDILRSRIEDVFIGIGQALLPVLSSFVGVLAAVIDRVGSVIDATDGWAGVIALLGGLVTGISMAISSLGLSFTAAGAAATAASVAIGAIGTVIAALTSPITLAIAAVAALAYAYKTNFGGIADVVDGTVDLVVSTVRGWMETLQAIVGPQVERLLTHWQFFTQNLERQIQTAIAIVTDVFRAAGEVWNNVFGDTTSGLTSLVDGFVGWLTSTIIEGMHAISRRIWQVLNEIEVFWRTHRDEIVAVATAFLQTVVDVVSWAMDLVGQIIQTTLGLVSRLWEEHLEPLAPTTDQVFGAIRTVISTVLGVIHGIAATVLPLIRQLWSDHIEPLSTETEATFTRISEVIEEVLGFIFGTLIAPFVTAMEELWNEHGDAIVADTIETWNHLTETISAALSFLYEEVFLPILNVLNELYAEHGEALVQETLETWGAIAEFLEPFITWIAEFITETFGWLYDRLQEITELALEGLRIYWDVFGEDIMNILSMVFETIITVAEQFFDALATVWRTAMAVIRGDWEQAFTLVSEFFSRTVERITDLTSGWLDTFVGLIQSGLEAVVGIFEWLYNRLIGNSIIPELYQAVMSITGDFLETFFTAYYETLSNVLSFIREWASKVLGGFASFVSSAWDIQREMLRTIADGFFQTFENIREFLLENLNRILSYFRDLRDLGKEAVRTMFNDTLSYASDWVSKFASRIETGVDRARGHFEDLRRAVSGNSIVPDMLDQTLDQTSNWQGDFEGRFDSTAGNVGGSFERMQDDSSRFEGGSWSSSTSTSSDFSFERPQMSGATFDSATFENVEGFGGRGGGGALSDVASDDLYNLEYVRQGDINLDAESPDDRYDTTAEQLAAEFTGQLGREVTEADVRAETPQMASGGSLLSDGLAFLHEGEEVATTDNVSKIDQLLTALSRGSRSSSTQSASRNESYEIVVDSNDDKLGAFLAELLEEAEVHVREADDRRARRKPRASRM